MIRSPFVLSASRRTDIPGFYSEWFMQRVRDGRAAFRHPYTHELIEVPVTPETVAAVVFWTKDFRPMMDRLTELDERGLSRFVVHYTVTGLGPLWEPRAPATAEAVENLRRLADGVGPERVFWRFDPIVLTEKIGVSATLDRFAGLAQQLAGWSRQCITSVMAPYRKLDQRLRAYEAAQSDRVLTPGPEEFLALARGLDELGRGHGFRVQACCTPGLAAAGLPPARCVDAGYIQGLSWRRKPRPPGRAAAAGARLTSEPMTPALTAASIAMPIPTRH